MLAPLFGDAPMILVDSAALVTAAGVTGGAVGGAIIKAALMIVKAFERMADRMNKTLERNTVAMTTQTVTMQAIEARVTGCPHRDQVNDPRPAAPIPGTGAA